MFPLYSHLVIHLYKVKIKSIFKCNLVLSADTFVSIYILITYREYAHATMNILRYKYEVRQLQQITCFSMTEHTCYTRSDMHNVPGE